MIAVVDYDAGNLGSVETALHHLGATVVTTDDRTASARLLFREAQQ